MLTLLIALWMAGATLIVPAIAEQAVPDVRDGIIPLANATAPAVHVCHALAIGAALRQSDL